MSSEIIHKATVKNGRLLFSRPKLVQTLMDGLEGKDVEITIEQAIRKKSSSQLAYYFGGIIRKSCMKADVFTGWEFNEIDNLFRREFLSYKKEIIITDTDGVIIQTMVKKVTEELKEIDSKEMSIFIEKVLMYCARLGILILDANEYKLRRYTRKIKI